MTDAANNQSYYANWVECKHDNTKAYTASGNVDVKATFVKAEPEQPSKTGFVDVPANSWYADAADFVAQRGLMSGVGENLFGGSQNTTRAMLMTILAPTAGATRAEMAVMLQQFVKLMEK